MGPPKSKSIPATGRATDRACHECGTALVPNSRFCIECGTSVELDERSLAQRLQESLGPDYDVMGELGQGGFAVVYLVGDRPRRAYLAVKAMRPELMLSGSVVKRFRREIRFASELQHPNIIPVVFAAPENADVVYYAMPRLRGKPLSKRIEEAGALPIPEALHVMRELATGLGYAHEHQILHRDVKPSNVLLESSGGVVILDFGIAKALSKDGGNLSISGELLGSPAYLSPEQAAGSKDLDHRVDIYGWGVVSYQLLTGRLPFTGDSVQQMLYQHMTAEPPSLRDLRPETPPRIITVVERCLEKDRDHRWRTLAEAARELEPF